MARANRGAQLIGLMSGTSTDGIDAAAVRFHAPSCPPGLWHVDLLSFVTIPYSAEVRSMLLDLAAGRGTPADVARADFLLGGLFADAAAQALAAAGLQPDDIEAVACSGHTVAHLPYPDGQLHPPATLQIGEPAVIAERLGVTVVSDFRVRDVAAGGQGAPLVPYFDFCFLRSPTTNRALLNIGGIANATILPAGCSIDDVVAFDTGPGNMPIDIAARIASGGRLPYDRDGALARTGRVDEKLLRQLMAHPFFSRRPPKSCGREQFGESFVEAARKAAPDLRPEDLVATMTELSARTAAEAIAIFEARYPGPWEVVVSGGGAHNPALLEALRRHLRMPVRISDELGVSADAKEAIAFAFLAHETLRRRPANVPSATGASGPRVLGKITPANPT